LKNLKLANDQWPFIEVIDFRYFTVEEVIDYMENYYKNLSRHIMIFQESV